MKPKAKPKVKLQVKKVVHQMRNTSADDIDFSDVDFSKYEFIGLRSQQSFLDDHNEDRNPKNIDGDGRSIDLSSYLDDSFSGVDFSVREYNEMEDLKSKLARKVAGCHEGCQMSVFENMAECNESVREGMEEYRVSLLKVPRTAVESMDHAWSCLFDNNPLFFSYQKCARCKSYIRWDEWFDMIRARRNNQLCYHIECYDLVRFEERQRRIALMKERKRAYQSHRDRDNLTLASF